MSFWWGSRNPKGGSPLASQRLVSEAEVWKAQLGNGSVKKVTADIDWDEPFWLRVEDVQKGWDEDNRFYVIITIRFANIKGRGQPDWEDEPYKVKVLYPANYPSEAPNAYIVYPHISSFSAEHMYGTGELCLFAPHDGRRHGWNPSENTGTSVALWAIQWIRAYREYSRTGNWPGDSAH